MSKVTLANEQKCHEAIEWISRLSADGNTCTLQAIQVYIVMVILQNIVMNGVKTHEKLHTIW